MTASDISVGKVDVSAYTIPTDAPEGDGTLRWDSTTLILCEIHAAGKVGLGYTYGNQATAFMADHLAGKCLLHRTALDIPALHAAMFRQVRNDGSRGIASMAISALDIALWDLKAKLLNSSLVDLFGAAHASVAAYGSGGFTTYSNRQLAEQLSGWVTEGLKSAKMKIGAEPTKDLERVRAAREAVGPSMNLFVDANGAYDVRQATAFAEKFKDLNVTWFEEPVSSDDLDGLRRVRDRVPDSMEIAAGEYGYDSLYFRRMLEAEAVDVLQLDATRCKGFTGFLEGAAVAASFGKPISAHCAPSLHMHVGCAIPKFRHVEYFHDHGRIEAIFFDGFIPSRNGELMPDRSRPGMGLIFKQSDAERFLTWRSK
ncbi:L-alanine-DL-glutamate epimerase-like enolase superfamily enzyme [Silvibacterium bohemicum]|uniref:L-alanine-DL-glutamate epimerase-like enolase superfamily enzyme n=1 Tax=Silvibacterium bohemicum TaxID=1577686 RepID=A0A841JP58_9BACT|nr:enolase C-terminal domain-like protein [Silvibacterium bohemicum]MBB6143073.1 L-alanine-DL-glutamate epimerase-like enolase superfamily enzyme [Silvibacterium bohemicum]